jgi:NADH:ubiquinone oxidoreductase subunit 2 (subunit N)
VARPPEDEGTGRAGPLPTVLAFSSGVIALIWAALATSWLLLAVGVFTMVCTAQYYFRYARHLPWWSPDESPVDRREGG